MAMDQQETFNWLVEEKSRLEAELASTKIDRDKWCTMAFDLAFQLACLNPALRKRIEEARASEIVSSDVLNFMVR